MLDSLDTLIAFALIFTVVSLLVTIVVQLITTAFDLRGKNLAWAVAETFEAIEPKLVAQIEGAGKQLADHVLRDALLSDKQFRQGIKTATAVRPEELFEVLHRIALGKKSAERIDRIPLKLPTPNHPETEAEKKAREGDNAETEKKNADIDKYNSTVDEKNAELAKVRQHVLTLFAGLGLEVTDLTPSAVADATIARMDMLRTAATTIADPALSAAVNNLLTTAESEVSVVKAKAAEIQARLVTAYQKFEALLDTGQERAEEWFRMHARYITFGAAIIFAAGLQLDTIEIFKAVSTNKAMRDKLVAQSSMVLGQGEKILALSGETLEQAFKTWKTNEANGETNEAVKKTVGGFELKIETNDTRESVHRKVAEKLAFPDNKLASEAATVAIKKLETIFDETAIARLGKGAEDYKKMKGELDNTGFALFPVGGWRWRDADGHALSLNPHIPGILCSMLLLTLGAPFWFNLLKSLASLRSTVAENISTEDKVDAKHGSNPPPGTPPKTIVASKPT